jgi:hypothetical protein
MRRESHVRFCEGGGVRFPSATRLRRPSSRASVRQSAVRKPPLRGSGVKKQGGADSPDRTLIVRCAGPGRGGS